MPVIQIGIHVAASPAPSEAKNPQAAPEAVPPDDVALDSAKDEAQVGKIAPRPVKIK